MQMGKIKTRIKDANMNLMQADPKRAVEWNELKNGVSVEEVEYDNTDKLYWWTCLIHGLPYQSTMGKRIGCEKCNHRKHKRSRILFEARPDLKEYWDRDNSIDPNSVTINSNSIIKWKCPKGHEWSAPIFLMSKRRYVCPYCSNRKLLVGFNDLRTTNPDLCKHWDYNDNEYGPEHYMQKSEDTVKWKCKHGHSFECKIKNMVMYDTLAKCPYCIVSEPKNLDGGKDLKTVRPDLAEEWDYENNLDENDNSYDPGEFLPSSKAKMSWICPIGHRWTAPIADRVSGTGCPYCAVSSGSSNEEREVQAFIRSLIPDVEVISNYRKTFKSSELDVYIPSRHLAFEYNGTYWHNEENGKDKYYHYDKWKNAKDEGIDLKFIWSDDYDAKKNVVEDRISRILGVGMKIINANGLKTAIITPTKREDLYAAVSIDDLKSFYDNGSLCSFDDSISYACLLDDYGIVESIGYAMTDSSVDIKSIGIRLGTVIRNGVDSMIDAIENNASTSVSDYGLFIEHGSLDEILLSDAGFLKWCDVPPDYWWLINGRGKRLDKSTKTSDDVSRDDDSDLTRIWGAGQVMLIKSTR